MKVKGGLSQRIVALNETTGKFLVCAVNGPEISHFFGFDKDRELVFEGNEESPLVYNEMALNYCAWGNLHAMSRVYRVTLAIDLNKKVVPSTVL
jgi:hypothetical protein